jgi:hypothetical protein
MPDLMTMAVEEFVDAQMESGNQGCRRSGLNAARLALNASGRWAGIDTTVQPQERGRMRVPIDISQHIFGTQSL